MDTEQRQSKYQNLSKLAETTGFSDICAQSYCGFFKNFSGFLYLNGKNYRSQDFSPINLFTILDTNENC